MDPDAYMKVCGDDDFTVHRQGSGAKKGENVMACYDNTGNTEHWVPTWLRCVVVLCDGG